MNVFFLGIHLARWRVSGMFTAAVGAFGRFGSAICLLVVATAFGTSDISLTSTGAVSISLTIETTQWVGDVNINPNNQITYLNC